MIRLILAVIGILLICVAGEAGFQIGVYCLLPGIITVMWKITKWITERRKEKQWWIDWENKRKADKEAEEQRKQDQLRQQEELVEKYKNSPVSIEMLRVICGGFPPIHFPTKITIYNHCVQSETSTQKRTYDFAQHRVHSLEWVFKIVHKREDLKYVVKPQIAMAEAINALLSNKYHISDYAKENMNFKTDSDGDSYTTITYESDHVVMVLKDTLPNRTF